MIKDTIHQLRINGYFSKVITSFAINAKLWNDEVYKRPVIQ